MATERIILGIDPGTVVMGYGILHIQGSVVTMLSAGVVKLNKLEEHYDKLKMIFDRIIELIEEYNPDELAIEEPFYGKNVQSMLKLGRAQGVAISAALYRKIPVTGYSPRKIKQSITGKGAASKEQVAAMLRQILKFEEQPKFLDATDALAVALCHFYQGNSVVKSSANSSQNKKGKVNEPGKKYTGWAAFLSDNPEKLK